MSRRKQQPTKRQHKAHVRPPVAVNLSEAFAAMRAEPKKTYGLPFILLEDEHLNVFHYVRGAWVPYDKRIADCRADCQITTLPQKLKNMTRYEVREQVT